MKKILSGTLFMLLVIALLNSCRKDYAREQYKEDIPFIKPDLTVKIPVDVSGFITDENNNPVFNTAVEVGSKTAVTDEFGYFRITTASVPKVAGFVVVKRTGYFTAYKTFLPQEGKETFVRIKLLRSNNPGDIDAAAGGAVDLPGGARLSLPANAVVVASSGAAYAGTINVSAHWIDPSNIQSAQLQMPGDARGIDSEGKLKLLNTLSCLAVELTGNAGERLQIATGKQATITMPVSAALLASAPATVPLWSFDETNGLWKEEGTATKNGAVYTATVSHFSFWAGATGLPLVQLTARIVNASLQPLANVAVGVRYAGQPFNAGYGRFGFTDANGYVYGAIPANSQLVLNVLTPCETEAYSHNFNTTYGDADLGVLTGNMGQGMVTISGNALNCSNQPITNGYVQTYDNGFYNRIPIVNGSFSFTGLACTNTTASYIVVDKNANQQNSPQTISLVLGLNDLGTLTACGTSTVGSVSITIDGVTTTYTEPGDPLNTYFSPAGGGWTTLVKLTSPNFTFQFSGTASAGNSHEVTDLFSPGFPGDRAIAPVPLAVNVTEYGLPGGFISGSFSGLMLDFPGNGPHNVSCEFRVRRFQ
jgi:hypothetical protein